MDELRQIGTSAGVRVPSFHDLLEALNHQVYNFFAGGLPLYDVYDLIFRDSLSRRGTESTRSSPLKLNPSS